VLSGTTQVFGSVNKQASKTNKTKQTNKQTKQAVKPQQE